MYLLPSGLEIVMVEGNVGVLDFKGDSEMIATVTLDVVNFEEVGFSLSQVHPGSRQLVSEDIVVGSVRGIGAD
jgi:hypothetical protein